MKNQLQGKTAILYRRVSTTDQKLFGGSLNAQQNSLKEFCKRNQIEILAEFEEDHSAKTFNRPAWKKLQAYAKENKSKVDFVLVFEWDRFSRNAYEALGTIEEFQKLGIEINCPDKWIDFDNSDQIIMKLLYFGIPEVDNKKRSEKVRIGMRQGLKEGRWNRSIPLGYVKGRDLNFKPLIKPDLLKAPLIKELFEEFSKGAINQSEILRSSRYKALKLSKSNLSRILQNIIYTGRVIVPAYQNEPERIVQALHEPILDIQIYNQVQVVLNKNNKIKSQKIKNHDSFVLRGYLTCSKCGANLTGSASKSKTGKRHYYYHCNSKTGCNERFRVSLADLKLQEYLYQLKPKENVLNFFKLIYRDTWEKNKDITLRESNRINTDIIYLESNQEALLNKLLEGVIDNELFKQQNNKIQAKINQNKQELGNISSLNDDILDRVNQAAELFFNLSLAYEKADTKLKRKLLSSIFEEKLIFENENYRTPKFNPAFNEIYTNMKKLDGFEIKKGDTFESISRRVVRTGIEPVFRP